MLISRLANGPSGNEPTGPFATRTVILDKLIHLNARYVTVNLETKKNLKHTLSHVKFMFVLIVITDTKDIVK